MRWIEIIRLRSPEKATEQIKEVLSAFIMNDRWGPAETRIYRHADWKTDWILHVLWDSESPEKTGSTLGLRLAETLGAFGLVNHSVWFEEF